jgi:hypothetical protein
MTVSQDGLQWEGLHQLLAAAAAAAARCPLPPTPLLLSSNASPLSPHHLPPLASPAGTCPTVSAAACSHVATQQQHHQQQQQQQQQLCDIISPTSPVSGVIQQQQQQQLLHTPCELQFPAHASPCASAPAVLQAATAASSDATPQSQQQMAAAGPHTVPRLAPTTGAPRPPPPGPPPPPPPPLPRSLVRVTPSRKQRQRLKMLHWDKLAAVGPDSVWAWLQVCVYVCTGLGQMQVCCHYVTAQCEQADDVLRAWWNLCFMHAILPDPSWCIRHQVLLTLYDYT